MKVLVITNMYPTNKNPFYGIFVKTQVECLRKINKVEVLTVAKKGTSFLAYIPFGIRNVICLLFKKFDLVHAHYGFHSALFAAIIKKKPLVITFHRGDALYEPFRNKIYNMLQKFVVSRSDYIIAVSSEIKNALVSNLSADAAKISLITCGLDTFVFSPIPKEDIRRDLEIQTDEKVVLFVGALSHRKGVDIISECARRLPNVTFLLIGSGQFRPNAENCKCLGIRPNSEIPKWINAADVVLLPSRSEGTPVVLMEALSCGVPVVASRVGGIPDLVRDGETGYLVEPEDVDSFEQKLRELLDNPAKRKQMGQQGRKDMIQNYDGRKIAEQIKQIYEQVLAK